MDSCNGQYIAVRFILPPLKLAELRPLGIFPGDKIKTGEGQLKSK
jgi:hypothetical protein